MDRASGFGPEGWGFDSLRACIHHFNKPIIQEIFTLYARYFKKSINKVTLKSPNEADSQGWNDTHQRTLTCELSLLTQYAGIIIMFNQYTDNING